MVALKRQQHTEPLRAGGLAKSHKGERGGRSTASNSDAAVALLEQSDLLNPPREGSLRDAVAQCLQECDDSEREEERLRALLAAFAGIKKGFPGSTLQRVVTEQPALLAEADALQVQEMLGLLARSCLLPGRVVEMVAARPDILTDLPPKRLAAQITHLKAETGPMGSQVACLWQKFPHSLWMTNAQVDERLTWLRGLGVPNDRIRFVYAREPVFTAPLDSFSPQLDFLRGLLGEGADRQAVGALLAVKPQYLTTSVARLEKLRGRIEAELNI